MRSEMYGPDMQRSVPKEAKNEKSRSRLPQLTVIVVRFWVRAVCGLVLITNAAQKSGTASVT